ncbi:MAG: hypothetical protein R2681_06650 [Pyrinomonadaceae bacterium]
MKTIHYIGSIIGFSLLFTQVSLGQGSVHEQAKFERARLQKSMFVLKQPEKVDRTSEYGTNYDPKPIVVAVDPKTGKYEYRWTGFDGKEKVVAYQRADSIEMISQAHMEKDISGMFVFRYEVEILSSSPTYFRNFIVQTFGSSADSSGHDKEKIMIGEMYPVGDFVEGIWRNWAFVGNADERVTSGTTITFQLSSESPPGIVECRAAGGEFGSIAADEEMPSELENEIPVNQDLARGYTIGPDERLLKFTDSEKFKYLLENLPKFLEAGWMSEGTAKNYENVLKKNDQKELLAKSEKDFKEEYISSEVYVIITSLFR